MATIFTANNAEVYQQHMGRWSKRLAVGFTEFAAVGNPGSILDVGCGTGSLTFLLAERFPHARLTGIDFSQSYVDFARTHTRDRHISFEQGDAAAMRYPDQAFDNALSLLVLNFIPEAEKAAREMARVTKVGGVVAAAVWDFRGGMPYQRMLFDTAAVLDPQGGETTRTKILSTPLTGPGELAATWKKIGLRDVAETSLTIRMEFQSFADYWEPFLGGQGLTGSYVKGLSDEKRTLIECHVRLAYLGGAEDGPRSFASTAWAVRGIR
ncbi:MAG: class I SAM-dependent methyltransferase [Xanthobacteraceae bacterium]